ncbi:hypothetical protein PSPO01_14753 [Paraphaeosphaeria sporulosa]
MQDLKPVESGQEEGSECLLKIDGEAPTGRGCTVASHEQPRGSAAGNWLAPSGAPVVGLFPRRPSCGARRAAKATQQPLLPLPCAIAVSSRALRCAVATARSGRSSTAVLGACVRQLQLGAARPTGTQPLSTQVPRDRQAQRASGRSRQGQSETGAQAQKPAAPRVATSSPGATVAAQLANWLRRSHGTPRDTCDATWRVRAPARNKFACAPALRSTMSLLLRPTAPAQLAPSDVAPYHSLQSCPPSSLPERPTCPRDELRAARCSAQ